MNGPAHIAYLIEDGGVTCLCVMTDEWPGLKRYPMNLQGIGRLAAECSRAMNTAIGGYNLPLAPKDRMP